MRRTLTKQKSCLLLPKHHIFQRTVSRRSRLRPVQRRPFVTSCSMNVRIFPPKIITYGCPVSSISPHCTECYPSYVHVESMHNRTLFEGGIEIETKRSGEMHHLAEGCSPCYCACFGSSSSGSSRRSNPMV